jgi:hypothetical protein
MLPAQTCPHADPAQGWASERMQCTCGDGTMCPRPLSGLRKASSSPCRQQTHAQGMTITQLASKHSSIAWALTLQHEMPCPSPLLPCRTSDPVGSALYQAAVMGHITVCGAPPPLPAHLYGPRHRQPQCAPLIRAAGWGAVLPALTHPVTPVDHVSLQAHGCVALAYQLFTQARTSATNRRLWASATEQKTVAANASAAQQSGDKDNT